MELDLKPKVFTTCTNGSAIQCVTGRVGNKVSMIYVMDIYYDFIMIFCCENIMIYIDENIRTILL